MFCCWLALDSKSESPISGISIIISSVRCSTRKKQIPPRQRMAFVFQPSTSTTTIRHTHTQAWFGVPKFFYDTFPYKIDSFTIDDNWASLIFYGFYGNKGDDGGNGEQIGLRAHYSPTVDHRADLSLCSPRLDNFY